MPKQPPKNTDKIIKRKQVTVNVPVVNVPAPVRGFVEFVRQQGVVGLAVGFVLGVAAKGVVDAFVNNIVNPIVGLYGNGGELAGKYWCMKNVADQCTNKFGYGAVINQIINFLVVAIFIYFVLRMLKLDKLDKPKKQ